MEKPRHFIGMRKGNHKLNAWVFLMTPMWKLGEMYEYCNDTVWHASKKYHFRWIIRIPFRLYWWGYDKLKKERKENVSP